MPNPLMRIDPDLKKAIRSSKKDQKEIAKLIRSDTALNIKHIAHDRKLKKYGEISVEKENAIQRINEINKMLINDARESGLFKYVEEIFSGMESSGIWTPQYVDKKRQEFEKLWRVSREW